MANNFQMSSLPPNYLWGFNLTYLNKSQISISPGYGRDNGDNSNIVNNEMIVLDVEKNGINGLDSGSLKKTLYNIFIISSQSGFKKTAAIASLSNNNPYLPEDYDSFRLIGFVSTDNIFFDPNDKRLVTFYQYGNGNDRTFYYGDNLLLQEPKTTFTTVDISSLIPFINNSLLIIEVLYTPSAVGNSAKFTNSISDFEYEIYGIAENVMQMDSLTLPIIVNNNLVSFKYKVSSSLDQIFSGIFYYSISI